jgi:hypothetical protein
MYKSLIRYLSFLSVAGFIISCNQYSHMRRIQADGSCILKFKPDFDHVVYKTSADVTGKHISGLILIKYMPDSSVRIVFSNETGLSFFDFGFMPDNGFVVYQIIPDMNNKALIKTLKKDFDLVLFRNLDNSQYYSLADSNLIYHAFPQTKGVNYYITDSSCGRLFKMQRSSAKRPVVEVVMGGIVTGFPPDSISIRHLNFNFTITLKKISLLAPE